jgi:hypothetical protein
MVSTTFRFTQICVIRAIVIVVSIFIAHVLSSDDPILDFYRNSAGAEFVGRNPVVHGAAFSFRATSILKTIRDGGIATVSDSALVDYFYSFGKLDSTKTVVAPKSSVPSFELDATNIFSDSLIHSFFPNDTGGPELAIGFDSPSSESEAPNGIVVIDRSIYVTKRVYLFFPNKVGYKRLSRIYDFALHNEYLVPEVIVEQGALSGIFSTSYYRMETRLTNITVVRKPSAVGQ